MVLKAFSRPPRPPYLRPGNKKRLITISRLSKKLPFFGKSKFSQFPWRKRNLNWCLFSFLLFPFFHSVSFHSGPRITKLQRLCHLCVSSCLRRLSLVSDGFRFCLSAKPKRHGFNWSIDAMKHQDFQILADETKCCADSSFVATEPDAVVFVCLFVRSVFCNFGLI